MRQTWMPISRASWIASSRVATKRRRFAGHTTEDGWLASAARHPDLRGQGGAESNRHGAGGSVRAGLPSLLIWLPARSLGSSGVTIAAYRLHESKTALGDRYRHRKVLRLDSALTA